MSTKIFLTFSLIYFITLFILGKTTQYKYDIKKTNIKDVSVFIYHSIKEECDDTPNITAFNYHIDTLNPYKHRFCAVSRDLKYLKDKYIFISNIGKYSGYYIVADLKNKRYINSIDILVNKDVKYGKWQTKIYY